ncbi:MAG: hypothetical protein RIQ56_22 [Candidatus Parcubacteria bacterium]|jgi:NAD(P)H-dependent FMN reductase
MEQSLAVKVILGSTRPSRFSDKPGKWIVDLANQRKDMKAELLDLRNFSLPLYNEPTSPSSVKDGMYANEEARRFAKEIAAADAFILVSPEYNHGISGVLKNALDTVYAEWNNKPVGFVSYGSVGGARVVEHLRDVSAELQMASVRTAVHIMAPWTLSDEKGELKAGVLDQYVRSAETMLGQLSLWAKAMKSIRV